MKEIEKEINLLDLFWYVCQKWRVIICVAIVFMFVFGAFGAYKNMTSGSQTESFDSESSFEALALLDQTRVKQYLLADEMYQKVAEENETDELLSIDYSNVYKVDAEYVIQENDNTVAIANLLRGNIHTFWNSLDDISKFNTTALYYDKGVTIYDGEDSKDLQGKSVVLGIYIYGATEEECQSSLESVKEIVEEAEKELKNVFGSYQLEFIDGESYLTVCDELKGYINEKKNTEYSRLNTRTSVVASLSESAKAYVEEYNKIGNQLVDEDTAEDSVATENDDNAEKKLGLSSFINFKFLLLGLLLGGMGATGGYFVAYILNTKVRFEEDIDQEYGLNLLGRVFAETKGNKLDQWLTNMRRSHIHNFTYQEAVEIIASELKVKALKSGVNKVYATGCMMGERQKKIVDDVAKVLAKANVELINGKSILYYPSALEESANVGNILLFEKSNESSYAELEQEIRKAESRGLDIIGLVLVE